MTTDWDALEGTELPKKLDALCKEKLGMSVFNGLALEDVMPSIIDLCRETVASDPEFAAQLLVECAKEGARLKRRVQELEAELAKLK